MPLLPNTLDHIPFNRPFIIGRELDYISEAVAGGQLAGNGPFTGRCQEFLQSHYGGGRVLLTTSCTAALEMAAILCDIGPGDEVILPSFTFVSTANAFLLRGATLRFVDIRPDTLNMDETLVANLITDRTKIICPVHYAGVGCEMDTLTDLAAGAGAAVVEDAAQAVGCTYRGRSLGTIGALAAYSFHETKNFIAGEGGALVVNDPVYMERAQQVAEKGTNRAQFRLGEVDKYSWVDLGSSYFPSEMIAAFLLAQLEHAATITEKRMEVWRRYWDGLSDLQESGGLRLPVVPGHCAQNGHMFFLLLPDTAQRNRLLQHLAARGINAVTHYVPLHSAPMGLRLGYTPAQLPVTEDLAGRLLRLPLFYEITREQQDRVIAEVRAGVGA